MANKKINQSDLRKLMRERSEGLTNKTEEKIESPLAKYDSSGRLSCIVCNIEITAKSPWRLHILTKGHKLNVNLKLKRKLQDAEAPPKDAAQIKTIPNPNVSNGTNSSSSDSKRLKKDLPTNLLGEYSSSSEDEEEPVPKAKKESSNPAISSALPPDFFDSPSSSNIQQNNGQVMETESVSENKNIRVPKSNAEIPEGFFDDPVLDAKARNVEYKDPKEEEWERFQKSIADETNVSESIIEEEAEKSEVDKSIDQIDEQIYNWQKVNNLLSQREDDVKKLHSKMIIDEEKGTTSSPEEDEDMEYFPDWRSKDFWKK